jgi:hypothetical protein
MLEHEQKVGGHIFVCAPHLDNAHVASKRNLLNAFSCTLV